MITDIEGTEPRLFYRLKSTKRKSPLRNAESGVGDVLQYHGRLSFIDALTVLSFIL